MVSKNIHKQEVDRLTEEIKSLEMRQDYALDKFRKVLLSLVEITYRKGEKLQLLQHIGSILEENKDLSLDDEDFAKKYHLNVDDTKDWDDIFELNNMFFDLVSGFALRQSQIEHDIAEKKTIIKIKEGYVV